MAGAYRHLRDNEQGFAAILVTIVLLIVVSLITTGFAIQMRKEQQAALDNQLSAQAYYAAESGVNDYARLIKQYVATKPVPTSVTELNSYLSDLNSGSCTPSATGIYSSLRPLANNLTSGGGVKYTCVTVNASPTELQYGNIGSTSQIIPIRATNTVDTLKITWQPTVGVSGSNPTAGCPSGAGIDSFPATSNWNCPLSVVRIDLVPTPLGSTYTLSSLQATTMTAFFVPTPQGSGAEGCIRYMGGNDNSANCSGSDHTQSNQYGDLANQGAVVGADCTDGGGGSAPSCTMVITNLSSNSYGLRISTIYGAASVNIKGYTGGSTSSNPVELSGAQVVIDSTGLAQDVLHRIQVRIPVGASAAGDTFNAAIQSAESLCKQFQTAPPAVYNSGPNGC